MRSALEPARPSIRKLTLRMRGESGETSQVTVGQVRGTVASNSRILNVVLAPGSLRGIGYLVQEGRPASDVQRGADRAPRLDGGRAREDSHRHRRERGAL